MTRLYRIFLGFFALLVPVVIAACYGAVDQRLMTKNGKVLDKDTKVGLKAIQVSCMVPGLGLVPDGGMADGGMADGGASSVGLVATHTTTTEEDGTFALAYEEFNECVRLEAVDVDGTANGSYQATSVDFCESCAVQEIEMAKQ
jgi:hypothetical protein